MENIKRQTQGVILITLTVTIVVLTILAGIAFYSGKETIQKAKLEELKTNMLLIQAKAREYVEEVNFRMGIGTEEEKEQKRETARVEIYEESEKLQKATNVPDYVTDANSCYELTEETRKKWGLDKIVMEANERYLIQFDEKTPTVEIYNTKGYDGKYSLTEIDKIEE